MHPDIEFHTAIFGGECRQKWQHVTQTFRIGQTDGTHVSTASPPFGPRSCPFVDLSSCYVLCLNLAIVCNKSSLYLSPIWVSLLSLPPHVKISQFVPLRCLAYWSSPPLAYWSLVVAGVRVLLPYSLYPYTGTFVLDIKTINTVVYLLIRVAYQL
jgi:hypothetical protein